MPPIKMTAWKHLGYRSFVRYLHGCELRVYRIANPPTDVYRWEVRIVGLRVPYLVRIGTVRANGRAAYLAAMAEAEQFLCHLNGAAGPGA